MFMWQNATKIIDNCVKTVSYVVCVLKRQTVVYQSSRGLQENSHLEDVEILGKHPDSGWVERTVLFPKRTGSTIPVLSHSVFLWELCFVLLWKYFWDNSQSAGPSHTRKEIRQLETNCYNILKSTLSWALGTTKITANVSNLFCVPF